MADGEKLPFEMAQKNLRNVNIFAYSYGASVVQLISDCLWKDMKSVGFSQSQAKDLQRQIFVLTAGANINANYYRNNFLTYHIVNTEDEVIFPLVRPLLKVKALPENAFVKLSLFKQPHQKVLLFSDKCVGFNHAPHHVRSYFPKGYVSAGHKRALFLKDCILANAINNSIENMNEVRFIPLDGLEKVPEKCLYLDRLEDQQEQLRFFQQAQLKKVSSHSLSKLDFNPQKIKE